MARDNAGWRLHRWDGQPTWEQWQIPDPAPGEVQVEIEACGVGLTVLNNMRGVNWRDESMLPRVPGHEFVGHVAAVGDGVEEHAPGDRVLAYFYLSCFGCAACQAGREERCENNAGRLGIHRDGGYARIVNLPAGNAIAFDADMDATAAVVIPDAVATPVHICASRLAVQPGDRVVVIGAGGGVGIHLVQVAATYGARVVGLDRTDDKLAALESMGVDAADSSHFDAVRLDDWDGVADAIVDFVGSTDSLAWAVDHLGDGGRLCVVTTFAGVQVPLESKQLVARELSVLGSHYASRREVAQAASLVTRGAVTPVVGHVVAPEEVEVLHDRLRASTLLGRGAIDWQTTA